MVRIGVFTGNTKKKGLTLHNFKVLNELEYTKVALGSFSLVARYNNFNERLVQNRIYLINIKDEPSKPVKHYEILDKCKFIKYVDGEYLITYKRYRGKNLIDFYDENPKDFTEYFNWVSKRGKDNKKLKLNTFTKTLLERLFDNYNLENIVSYNSNKEKDKWNEEITKRVKNFNRKIDDASTNWSKDEEKVLWDWMNMDPDVRPSEKELSKMLGRTVPSIASKKWKLKTDYKSKLSKLKNMKDQATQIAEKMKDFRAKQGWSQRKLVEESDISLSVINQLECKNYSSLNGPTVQKLMDYIDNYTPKEDTTEKDTGVVSSKKEVEKVAEQPKEKEVVDMPGESLNMLVNKLDAMTSQLERLNTNMEEMNKLHKDQFKKEKLFNEIKELAREVA